MISIPVKKVAENGGVSTLLLEETMKLGERIRKRAYELFQCRHAAEGSSLKDWLDAERELVLAPEADLVEKDGQFQLQIAMPSFNANEISVTAFPDTLTVRAESARRHEKRDGKVYFCEFGEKTLFRKFDLPGSINVEKVTANLDKGMLQISAAKSQSVTSKAKASAA